MSKTIIIGGSVSPLYTYDELQIERIICNNSLDIIGDELSSDVLEVSVFCGQDVGALVELPYMTVVEYYKDSGIVGKYYLSSVERTGLEKVLIKAVSMIGVLDKERFYGDFYINKSFQECFYDILCRNSLYTPRYRIYSKAILKFMNSHRFTSTAITNAGWNSRLYYDVVLPPIEGSSLTKNFIVGGYNKYNVEAFDITLMAERSSTTDPFHVKVRVRYGTFTTEYYFGDEEPLFGIGSRFIIDVAPSKGYIKVRVEYKKYDELDVEGVYEKETDISVYAGSNSIALGAAFGYCQIYNTTFIVSSTEDLQYLRQRMYTANDVLIMDVFMGADITQAYYDQFFVDAISGEMYFTTNGHAIVEERDLLCTLGQMGELKRLSRVIDDYVVEDDVWGIKVNGWLPVDTRRNSLHKLLFSTNVNIIKGRDGVSHLDGISYGNATILSDEVVYDKGSVEKIGKVKKISITEHSFNTVGVSSQVLFDNTNDDAPVGEYIATFNNAPIFGTPTTSGITIVVSNCNVAIATGRGTISGTPYYHSQRSIIEEEAGAIEGNDVSVGDIALINYLNSDNIMKKLKAYYMAGVKKTKTSIIFNGEMCGETYEFPNVYYERDSGFLTKESITASAIDKAECEFISGYYPPSVGGYFYRHLIEVGNDWTIPSSVKASANPTIRAVLIGRGREGENGEAGEDGTLANDQSAGTGGSYGRGGEGGSKGVAGNGGDILQETIDVSSVSRIACTQSGYNVTLTIYNDSSQVIGSYVSSDGLPKASGFTDLFTGTIYARKGMDGVDGGDGGDGGMGDNYNQTQWYGFSTKAAEGGEGVGGKLGGRAGKHGSDNRDHDLNPTTSTSSVWMGFLGGGGGGGASVKNVGENGWKDYARWPDGRIVIQTIGKSDGGSGGNGGDPATQNPEYGSGGNGGNGGGGGGGAGLIRVVDANGQLRGMKSGVAGMGGTGGLATSGVDGCVIIYY